MRPADYARLSQIIAESYHAETLYKAVTDTFKSRFDEKRLLAVRQAWRSPLFKRISALEAQASTPEAARRLREFAVELRRAPPPADRLALIRRVDTATRSTDTNLEIVLATIRGIVLGMDPMMPASQRLKAGQLDQILSDMRAEIRAPLKNQVQVTLLYAYQSLADEELRTYLAYVESEAGRWFDRVAKDGILSGMAAAADRVGRQMGKALAANPRPPADPPRSGDPGNGSLTAVQKTWALATSAVLTEHNRQRHDLLGGEERSEKAIGARKRDLSAWWNVNSRADLFAVLKWLEEGGHRQHFEELGAFVESLSPEQYRQLKVKTSLNREASHQLAMVEKHYRTLGPKSLMGWDYGRYVWLCRSAYLVGYLTEEEAWERIMDAARTLQRSFDSWKDLGENYLIGREFWSLHQTRESGDRFRDAYARLLKDPASPWNRHAWETNLHRASVKPVKASR
ncbi:MAG: DUF1266 domain-containing protein [Candidatus Rokubacteria bacterium]|nr:DUF1266 domain-containing protein [Candidatus Rokubacteria bacterium]